MGGLGLKNGPDCVMLETAPELAPMDDVDPNRRLKMSNATYFVQECPTCGRKLQVRVEHLGKKVVCRHCAAKFEAYDSSSGSYPPTDSSVALLARAEELIDTASRSGIGLRQTSSEC